MKSRTRKSARRGGIALAVIAVITVASTTAVFAIHQYPDVPDSNPFHDDIAFVTDKGIANGFADGNFHPADPVSRQAMSAFLHRTYDILFPQQFDRSFHVFVVCAASTRFAVVSSAGTFIRGSAGTTSSKLSTGTYSVTFDIDVHLCSWQITVGQTGNSGSTTGWADVAGRSGNNNALFITTWDVPHV